MSIPFDATMGGERPNDRVTTDGRSLDQIPLGTFFISQGSTSDRNKGHVAMQLVRLELVDPEYVTPGGRGLHYFWRMLFPGVPSEAVDRYGMVNVQKRWRWIVRPGQEGYELLESFKFACTHLTAIKGEPTPVPCAPLWRALGIEES